MAAFVPGANPSPPSTAAHLEVEQIRRDFPILQSPVRGKPLVYFDNAATSQKPQVVIDTLVQYYRTQNANVHRGVHYLSELATRAYEDGREVVRRFLNAASTREIIFVRGTTEGINLVAQSYGRRYLRAGDEIIITAMEHHSNIVPWQMLCEETGARLRVIPINSAGEWIWEKAVKLFNPKTKFVACVHVSNSLGTINPIRRLIQLAHEWHAPVLIDGAQAVPHQPVNVAELDCDFYTFSGHKVFGPTGIGVLYGKEAVLEKMAPYQGGGDMIKSVTFAKTTYNDLPYRFEAGTPNIAGAVGLAKALEYVSKLGYDRIAVHEHELLQYATAALATLKPLRLIGTAREKASVVSFVLEGIHPHDVGTILDRDGIAIRTGHHCTQPVMEFFNIPATSRASFAFYNTRAEIDVLVEGLHKVIKLMTA